MLAPTVFKRTAPTLPPPQSLAVSQSLQTTARRHDRLPPQSEVVAVLPQDMMSYEEERLSRGMNPLAAEIPEARQAPDTPPGSQSAIVSALLASF